MPSTPVFIMLRLGFLLLMAVLPGCSSDDASGRDLPRADYDATTGRLRRLTFDLNQNGRNDAVGVMDGTRIDHIEIDTDEDGATDRWEYYGAGGHLVKAAVFRQHDGIIDAYEFYAQGDGGLVTRIEVSTRRDNRFDRVEFYTSGVLARVEEDTNGDTRVDKWEVYRPVVNRSPGDPPSSVASVAFDDAYRGTATRRLVFADDGTVQRVEIDPEGDGVFVAQSSRTGAH